MISGVSDSGLAMLWRSLFPAYRFLSERDGVCLPPGVLRAAGPLFEHDRVFRTYAAQDVKLIERYVALRGKSILDVGCGVGRLYFGIRASHEPASYLGVDVKPDVIEWADRNIGAANPRFRFLQLDVQNERYNPEGALRNESWSLALRRS